MVTFSVARAYPSANELLGQMPSSNGELTVQFEMRTFLHASTSMPSRLVSILRLSIVRLSTPVARIAKCPPCRIVISRRFTLRQFFSAIALLPQPGSTASRGFGYAKGCLGSFARAASRESFWALVRDCAPLLTRPFPQIIPGPRTETFVRFSPQIRLLCQ